MAESFSRQKSRHAPQKEGGLKILCDLPPVCVTPAGTSNELDVQNGWEENTHTHGTARTQDQSTSSYRCNVLRHTGRVRLMTLSASLRIVVMCSSLLSCI